MRHKARRRRHGNKFQSAPGREAGRCSAAPKRPSAPLRFQSAPGREAGRCSGMDKAASTVRTFQSAPGREAGRCGTPIWYGAVSL